MLKKFKDLRDNITSKPINESVWNSYRTKALQEDAPGLDVPTPSVQDIAKKHGVSIESIESQLKMGIEVEHEHSTSDSIAREIALDHLNERPDYYTQLKKMEDKPIAESVDARGRIIVDDKVAESGAAHAEHLHHTGVQADFANSRLVDAEFSKLKRDKKQVPELRAKYDHARMEHSHSLTRSRAFEKAHGVHPVQAWEAHHGKSWPYYKVTSSVNGSLNHVKKSQAVLKEDVNMKNFMSTYKRNESQNRHTKNAEMLAQHFGDESDKALAAKGVAALKKHGYQPHAQELDTMHIRLYKKAQAMKEGFDSSFYEGDGSTFSTITPTNFKSGKTIMTKVKSHSNNLTSKLEEAYEVAFNESGDPGYKVGDQVITKVGEHKGQKHTVIHVFDTGHVNIKPNVNHRFNRYHHGAVKAHPDDIERVPVSENYTGINRVTVQEVFKAAKKKIDALPQDGGKEGNKRVNSSGKMEVRGAGAAEKFQKDPVVTPITTMAEETSQEKEIKRYEQEAAKWKNRKARWNAFKQQTQKPVEPKK